MKKEKPTSKSSSPIKKRLTRKKLILFTMTAIFLVFGTAEIVFRVFDFQFYFSTSANILGLPVLGMSKFVRVTSKAVEYDGQLFWKLKPNKYLTNKIVYKEPVRINNMGARGEDFSANKPRDTFRILCLGDSVTFGWSVGEGEPYAPQLEKLLNEIHPGKNFEAINMGVPGYSSRQGLEYLRLKGAGWQPDLVIFAFGPNDKLPALKSDKELLKAKAFEFSTLTKILAKSQVYKLMRSAIILGQHYAASGGLSEKEFIPRLKRKVNASEFVENMAEAKKLAWEAGAEFMLINIQFPSRPKDMPYVEVEKAAKKAGAKMPKAFEPMDTLTLIEQFSEADSVPFVDFYPHFEKQLKRIKAGHADSKMMAVYEGELKELVKKNPNYYIMVDPGHPNEWGHRLAAEAIYTKLVGMEGFGLFTEYSRPGPGVEDCVPDGMDEQPRADHIFVGDLEIGEIGEGSDFLIMKLVVDNKYRSLALKDVEYNVWVNESVTTPKDKKEDEKGEELIVIVKKDEFDGTRGYWAVLLDDVKFDDGSDAYKFVGACEL